MPCPLLRKCVVGEVRRQRIRTGVRACMGTDGSGKVPQAPHIQSCAEVPYEICLHLGLLVSNWGLKHTQSGLHRAMAESKDSHSRPKPRGQPVPSKRKLSGVCANACKSSKSITSSAHARMVNSCQLRRALGTQRCRFRCAAHGPLPMGLEVHPGPNYK